MAVRLQREPLDPWGEVARHEARNLAGSGRCGAAAVFVGTMRDLNEGESVQSMVLEHYPGMTERYLEGIETQARGRWPVEEVLVVHRWGELLPGDPIVVVAAWSSHRAAALDACRFLIEELKARAPFWKKERLADRERWVEHNTPA